ncbi:MAG: glycerol-3-phosphate acyltransferase [Bacteroidetes bacterium]|nr:glycerol-3-phosphate acyltransferase [Bacteroidota bacterium]
MHQIIHITLIALAAFLVGSFPTAYVIVRRRRGKDLRNEGSGNIGTLNAYEVTRSRRIGIFVLLVDLFKGALPVLLVSILFPDDFIGAGAALCCVVLGHNYSPWIGWKGGRGLAPAAGATLAFNPLFLALWGLFWLAAFWKSRDVHFGNIAATVLAPFVVLLVQPVFAATSFFPLPSYYSVSIVFFILSGLVFLKHLGPLQQLIATNRQKNRDR